jgi:hypothetical protein
MRPTRASLALLALGAACALPGQRSEPRARLAVEVLQGFREPPAAAASRAPRVEILLDLTASMRAEVASGVTRALVARRLAERFAGALPGEVELGARVLGGRAGSCRAPGERAAAHAGESREDWLRRLGARAPTGEGSLAAALEALAAELAPAAAARDAREVRVAVFTDLGAECGGDLCSALAGLVAAGAPVDLVAVGGAPAPECAHQIPAPGPPRLAQAAVPDPAPRFRVERAEGSGAGSSPVLAAARADGVARSLLAGPATVVIDLEPPARLGPIVFEPGRLTRLRILDFAGLEPPVREWSLETLPLAAGTAADAEAAKR